MNGILTRVKTSDYPRSLLITFVFSLCLFLSACSTLSTSKNSDYADAKLWLNDPDSAAISRQIVWDESNKQEYSPVQEAAFSAAVDKLSEKPFVKLTKNEAQLLSSHPPKEQIGRSYYLVRAIYPAYEPNTAGLTIYERDREVVVVLGYLGSLGPVRKYPIVALLANEPDRFAVLTSGAR